MHDLYLSLGSSIGDRERHLADAIAHLRSAGIGIERLSSLYETQPVGENAGPGWFLNMAAAGRTDLDGPTLVNLCVSVEEAMGRQRSIPGGPREIDIDVLMLGDEIVSAPGCQIPHPRMPDRRFVLEPLAEIAPGAIHAPSGRTVSDLLARLHDPSRVVKLGPLHLVGACGGCA